MRRVELLLQRYVEKSVGNDHDASIYEHVKAQYAAAPLLKEVLSRGILITSVGSCSCYLSGWIYLVLLKEVCHAFGESPITITYDSHMFFK